MISAVIQARMTSSRLPGKVLMEVDGKPLLEYLITNLKKSTYINDIILAITTNTEDDPLEEFAHTYNINVFRGSEDNVLERFYLASQLSENNHIARITADCPLLDASICDKAIDLYLSKKADYTCLTPKFAEGLDFEVFSKKVLEEAHLNAIKASEREHVTLYIHNNKDQFNIQKLDQEEDDSHYRFTVDEKKDFIVMEHLLKNVVNTAPDYTTKTIKDYLNAHPDIMSINQNIIRNEGLLKSLKNDH